MSSGRDREGRQPPRKHMPPARFQAERPDEGRNSTVSGLTAKVRVSILLGPFRDRVERGFEPP